jgi:hypothetical protein
VRRLRPTRHPRHHRNPGSRRHDLGDPRDRGILIAFAAISGRITGTPITAPIIFTAGGLVLGIHGAGLIDVDVAGETVKLLAEVTLALVLFVDASRVDFSALRPRNIRSGPASRNRPSPDHRRRFRRRTAGVR